jgi:anti-sigma B factor antagonist
MTLAIHEREREGIVILALAGGLGIGPADIAFRTSLEKCIAAGRIRIIVECNRLRVIDDVGLGTLIRFHAELLRTGGGIVLLNIEKTKMEVLVKAKAVVVFEVFVDEIDAVNSFFLHRAVKLFDVPDFVQKQHIQPEFDGTSSGQRPQTSDQNV